MQRIRAVDGRRLILAWLLVDVWNCSAEHVALEICVSAQRKHSATCTLNELHGEEQRKKGSRCPSDAINVFKELSLTGTFCREAWVSQLAHRRHTFNLIAQLGRSSSKPFDYGDVTRMLIGR